MLQNAGKIIVQVFCIKPCDIQLILLWDAPVMSQRTESHPVAVDKHTYGINCLLLLLLFLFECLKKTILLMFYLRTSLYSPWTLLIMPSKEYQQNQIWSRSMLLIPKLNLYIYNYTIDKCAARSGTNSVWITFGGQCMSHLT